jgi:hypothetical protein
MDQFFGGVDAGARELDARKKRVRLGDGVYIARLWAIYI